MDKLCILYEQKTATLMLYYNSLDGEVVYVHVESNLVLVLDRGQRSEQATPVPCSQGDVKNQADVPHLGPRKVFKDRYKIQ